GALKPYVEQVLTHLGRLPFKVNDQYLAPVVKDVPFSERYRHYEFIDTNSKDMGEIGDTQLLYLVNKEHAVVAWRGTESGSDYLTDVNGIQANAAPILSSGSIHLGFKNAYQDISANKKLEDAKKLMDGHLAGKPLFICGHSLGGALALIHAAERRADKPLLYTYGMPRVFDRSAVAQLSDIVHYRHVNSNDLITAVPHPKWATTRATLALSMQELSLALMNNPDSELKSLFDKNHLTTDRFNYQHHGNLIHFPNFNMDYDAGPGYQNMGWMAPYSDRVKNTQLKSILAPSIIGASSQKAYELVTRQYSKKELDNPDRVTVDMLDHSSSIYARYLGERLYDRLCQKYGTPSNFEIQANKIKQIVHLSVNKDKPAELNAFLQADACLLKLPLLPISEQPIILNGFERCYNYAMQQLCHATT
ncbi:MAG: lipase family protein, partial [Shewanella sp.]